VKQQEIILDQRKEIEELKEELKRVEELEERLDRIEAREKEARQAIIKEKRQMTEEETLNQIEVQKVLNQQVKEKIQKNNGQKRK
jgi:cell division protein ZapA